MRVWTPFVIDVDYDAKGQRTLIEQERRDAEPAGRHYGLHARPADDFRLVHVLTRRNA